MPYLKQNDRDRFNYGLQNLAPKNAGDLNYIFTKVIEQYLKEKFPIEYSHLNAIVGALESAKLEFYRRFMAKYEEEKIQQNGDIDMYKEPEEGDKDE
jgi:hypothetical protein